MKTLACFALVSIMSVASLIIANGKTEQTKPTVSAPASLVDNLQDVSVTINIDNNDTGSGSIKTRNGISYVWTAAHVVKKQLKTRKTIDATTGLPRVITEFDDIKVVKEFVEDGRMIGRTQVFADVIKYSDPEYGDDVAILRIKKRNFSPASMKTYSKSDVPKMGTELYHIGSMGGSDGINSLSPGIVAQVGRIRNKNKVFDQVTTTASPGSSGGGIFLKETGEYMGMVLQWAGQSTIIYVRPVREIRKWAQNNNIAWALDDTVALPSDEEMAKIPVIDKYGLPAPADLGLIRNSGTEDSKSKQERDRFNPNLVK